MDASQFEVADVHLLTWRDRDGLGTQQALLAPARRDVADGFEEARRAKVRRASNDLHESESRRSRRRGPDAVVCDLGGATPHGRDNAKQHAGKNKGLLWMNASHGFVDPVKTGEKRSLAQGFPCLM